MILSIDIRTDIPAFYSKWILNRFDEGFLMVRNPYYPSTIYKIPLNHEYVEGIVWWSKNFEPIMQDKRFYDVISKFPSYFEYTITPYENDIEQSVPSVDKSIETLQKLSMLIGNDKINWRYDPILLTKKYTEDFHVNAFRKMGELLKPYIDRCSFNIVNLYSKTRRHCPEIIPFTDETKHSLLSKLNEVCGEIGLELQGCASLIDFNKYSHFNPEPCFSKEILHKMNIWPKDNNRGNNLGFVGCNCYPMHSVGEYNTCLHKCKYCYASKDFNECDKNYKLHDDNSPLLIGWPNQTDEIKLIKKETLNTRQLELF